MISAIASSYHIYSLWVWATEWWEFSRCGILLSLGSTSKWWETSSSLLLLSLRSLLDLCLDVHLWLLNTAILWHAIWHSYLWNRRHTSNSWETSKTGQWGRLEIELLIRGWICFLKFMISMSERAFITIFAVSILKVLAKSSLVSCILLLVLVTSLETTSVTSTATSTTEASATSLIVTAMWSWLVNSRWLYIKLLVNTLDCCNHKWRLFEITYLSKISFSMCKWAFISKSTSALWLEVSAHNCLVFCWVICLTTLEMRFAAVSTVTAHLLAISLHWHAVTLHVLAWHLLLS